MQSRLAKGLLAFAVSVFASTFLLGPPALLASSPPTVTHSIKNDKSTVPLKQVHPPTKPFTGAGHEAARNEGPRMRGVEHKGVDTVVQRHFGSSQPTPSLNFDGGTAAEMGPFFGFEVAPPDTEGAVGDTQYMQFVNSVFHVYDKTTGENILGPLPGTAFFTGFGGFCEMQDVTDPVTKYDQLANRWMIGYIAFNIFVQNEFHVCMAVSQTSDATGLYNRYDFQYNLDIPDYPKWGVWPDAYYMTTDQFPNGSFSNSRVTAFDRNAMLNGDPASTVAFDLDPTQFAPLPGDLQGANLPPDGSPNPIVATSHPNWDGGPPGLHFWYFHVDFVTPGNSTFLGPYDTSTPDFNPVLCGFSRDCIPELNGEGVDAISGRTMFRAQYRNFGDHDAMTISQTVNVSDTGDQAGVRWTEVRGIFAPISVLQTPSGNPAGPTYFQSGTYSPDSTNRWMPSIAMDMVGNMALGYSISDATINPAMGVTGRFASDPLGTMGDEIVMYAGTGSQQNTANRWGDYSDMEIDPIDGCTFWYTNEYYATDSSFNWQTRIGSFQFPGCAGPAGTLEGNVTDTSKNPIQNATVTANAFSTTTDASGHYHFILPVGSYNMTASKFGYTPASADGVGVTDGGDTIQNFALAPNLNLLVNGTVKDGSGAGWPLYARIDITGPPGFPGATLFTDPNNGYYSITLAAGYVYHFMITSLLPGYNVLQQDVNVPIPPLRSPNDPPGVVANFLLTVDAGLCIAPGYTPGAPSVLMSESFDGGALPAGWSVVDNTGFGGWNIVSDFAPCFEVDGNPTGGSGPFALINSDCDGFVPLDTELHTSSVDFSAFGGGTAVFKQDYFNAGDVADVDVSTDGGNTWSNALHQTASDRGPTSIQTILPGVGGQSNVQLRFHFYNAFFGWWWAVDDLVVNGSTCNPGPNGLVVGLVTDSNTGNGLVGATVQNTPDGDTTTTVATPLDPNMGDGFYALAANSGNQPFQASKTNYETAQLSTLVIPGGTVRLDFALAAGWLSTDQASMSSKVLPGAMDMQTLNIINAGTGAGDFTILEINAPLAQTAQRGPFAPKRTNKQIKQVLNGTHNLKNFYLRNLAGLPKPSAPAQKMRHLNAAGDILTSWPSGLPLAWGVTFEGSNNSVWLSNNTYIGSSDDAMHNYTNSGTDTGNTISLIGAGGLWVGDAATNGRTGNLWGVNVGGDDCLVEMDPSGLTLTGNEICGTWGAISARGVAYDPATDTYFVGGWNEGIVYHIDGTGAVLDSHQLNFGNCFPSPACISGLAFDPGSGHLMVMQNEGGQDPIVVVDTTNNYSTVGTIAISGFTDFGGAGMEFDCLGNLWLIDQNTQTVYEISSGEPGGACSSDIPWLSETPTQGSVPPAAGGRQHVVGGGGTNPFPIMVMWDSTNLFPGLRQAQLGVQTDTPYNVPNVGINFTVRFLDVLLNVPPGTDTFENYIYAAAGANIMHGCSFFNFCPSAQVTRADMAGYIYRSVHGPFTPPPVYTGIFGDVFFGDYNADYIQGVFDDGITAGCQASPLLYCPNQSIPRGQMAVFIEKGVRGSSYVPPPCVGIFGDVTCPATPTDPYGDWVELLYNDGITSGCSTSPLLFCPLTPIPNEQMAVFIVKAFGFPVLP
jgi:hypothetical protein